MKKFLLGTTALIAAGAFVGAAQADDEMMEGPVTVGISGYTTAAVTISSDSSDTQRGEQIGHVHEFAVSGSTTLDNGITVAIHAQLGQSSGSWNTGNGDQSPEAVFDEQHITLSGSFGSFRVGRTESAAFNATVGAPGAGIGGMMGVNYPWFAVAAGVNTYSGLGAEDAVKVVYNSPNFNGLGIGLSHAPEDSEATPYPGRGTADAGDVSGHTALGVNYSTDFMEGGSLSLGMGYETASPEDGGDAVEAMKFGAVVSVDQISFGGGMYDADAGSQYDVGASWTQGPMEVGLQYGADEGGDTNITALHLTYTLGPGILVGGQLASGSADVTQFILGTAIFF